MDGKLPFGLLIPTNFSNLKTYSFRVFRTVLLAARCLTAFVLLFTFRNPQSVELETAVALNVHIECCAQYAYILSIPLFDIQYISRTQKLRIFGTLTSNEIPPKK